MDAVRVWVLLVLVSSSKFYVLTQFASFQSGKESFQAPLLGLLVKTTRKGSPRASGGGSSPTHRPARAAAARPAASQTPRAAQGPQPGGAGRSQGPGRLGCPGARASRASSSGPQTVGFHRSLPPETRPPLRAAGWGRTPGAWCAPWLPVPKTATEKQPALTQGMAKVGDEAGADSTSEFGGSSTRGNCGYSDGVEVTSSVWTAGQEVVLFAPEERIGVPALCH